MIGDVHFVRAFWYRNSLANEPAWRYVIPPEATPQNTDWNRFLGPRAQARLGVRSAISNGAFIGIIRAASPPTCWCTRPTSSTSCWTRRCRNPAWPRAASTAGTTTATRPTPSAPSTNIRGNFQINYSCYFGNDHYGYGEQLCGNEGTIEVMNRQDLYFTPEVFKGKASGQGSRAQADPPERQERFQRSRRRHQPFPQLHPIGAGQRKADRPARGWAAGGHFRPHGDAVV